MKKAKNPAAPAVPQRDAQKSSRLSVKSAVKSGPDLEVKP